MIADIYKPDTSTLVTTGHFYFGWTQCKTPNDIFTVAGLDSKELNLEEDVHGESAAIY
jgi:hypothetical protein